MSMASPVRLLISSSVPIREPRYLHFFHSSVPSLVIVYSSVFCTLMVRFLFSSFAGTVLLMFSVICIAYIDIDIMCIHIYIYSMPVGMH